MKQRFAVFTEWRKPKIYTFPINQTARLINEVPGRKVEIFETLGGARDAALTIIKLAMENANSSMFATRPNPEDEELLKTLSELTEDRVERYYF